MNKFFLVWNESMSMPKVKHDTWEKARSEADRIAIKHPGDKIHILMSVGSCVKREVDFEKHT